MSSLITTMWPFRNLSSICWPQSKHSKAFKHRIFIFTDLLHGYIDVADVL